jgi:hypothetical protein
VLERGIKLGVFRVPGVIDVVKLYIFLSKQVRLDIVPGGRAGKIFGGAKLLAKIDETLRLSVYQAVMSRPGYSRFDVENRTYLLDELKVDIAEFTLSTTFLV